MTVSKDGGTAETLTGTSYTVTANGSYKFVVTNGAGVTAEKTVLVDKIDRVKPVVSIDSHGYTSENWKNGNVTLDVSKHKRQYRNDLDRIQFERRTLCFL